jgi:hypothetical protein
MPWVEFEGTMVHALERAVTVMGPKELTDFKQLT